MFCIHAYVMHTYSINVFRDHLMFLLRKPQCVCTTLNVTGHVSTQHDSAKPHMIGSHG